MRVNKFLVLTCVVALSLTAPTPAQTELSARGILATAKFAGACGILDSVINFQKTTRMPGGDDFVTRFWVVEAARLGLSVQALSDRCDQSIMAYDKLWKAGDSKPK